MSPALLFLFSFIGIAQGYTLLYNKSILGNPNNYLQNNFFPGRNSIMNTGLFCSPEYYLTPSGLFMYFLFKPQIVSVAIVIIALQAIIELDRNIKCLGNKTI